MTPMQFNTIVGDLRAIVILLSMTMLYTAGILILKIWDK